MTRFFKEQYVTGLAAALEAALPALLAAVTEAVMPDPGTYEVRVDDEQSPQIPWLRVEDRELNRVEYMSPYQDIDLELRTVLRLGMPMSRPHLLAAACKLAEGVLDQAVVAHGYIASADGDGTGTLYVEPLETGTSPVEGINNRYRREVWARSMARIRVRRYDYA
jgi:hypothetical protein